MPIPTRGLWTFGKLSNQRKYRRKLDEASLSHRLIGLDSKPADVADIHSKITVLFCDVFSVANKILYAYLSSPTTIPSSSTTTMMLLLAKKIATIALLLLCMLVPKASCIFNQAHPHMTRAEIGPPKRIVNKKDSKQQLETTIVVETVEQQQQQQQQSSVSVGVAGLQKDDDVISPLSAFKFVGGFSVLIGALFLFFMVSSGLL